MNRPVYIEYETKTREFDGRLLLISFLLNKGIKKIFLGTKSGISREMQNSKNGIYIAKSLSTDGQPFYEQLLERNFDIILLHVEGGILYKDIKDLIISYFPKELMSSTSLNFVFGKKIRDGINKYINSEKLKTSTVVSGEPRFDLLKPKYKGFFHDEVNNLKLKYGDFILINTSFSVANPYAGEDRIKDFFMKEGTYSDEVKSRLLYKMSYLKEVLHKYLQAIEALAKNNSSRKIVIRPHPSESKKIYNDYFKKTENVFVENYGNVVSWIHACKAVIHYDCTTGMEAALAKKPVISYLPKFDEKVVAWLPIAISCKVTNQEDLINKINSIYKDDYNFTIPKDTLHEWQNIIHNVKHESSEIISEKILQIQDIPSNNEFSVIIQPKLIYIRLKKFLSYIFKTYLKKTPVSLIKSGSISKKEVRTKLVILNQIHSFNYSFKLSYQGHDVIRILKSQHHKVS